MVEQSERKLGRIVVDIGATEPRIYLEGAHQLEPEPAREEVLVVLLDDAMRAGGEVLVELQERVIDDDLLRLFEPSLDVSPLLLG